MNSLSLSQNFYCPISGMLMENPVIDLYGHSYERKYIMEWLTNHKNTSPLTQQPLELNDLRPNITLKNSIDEIRSKVSKEQLQISPQVTNKKIEDIQLINQNIKLQHMIYNKNELFVKVKMPDIPHRHPVDVCLCIDISGSMGTEATLKNDTGETLRNGITVLSLTVSAAKTILYSLDQNDTITVVVYSDVSTILVENMAGTVTNKKMIDKKLDSLKPTNTTNIWDGIRTSMDSLRTNLNETTKCIFLLTDGVPNIEPVRGHEYELKKYLSKYPDFHCMINSYGFGYSLNSPLLQTISKISSGDGFSFIPDSSLLGNIFIHGISNLMTTCEINTTLKLELSNGTFSNGKSSITITIPSLKYGQDKNLYFRIDTSIDNIIVSGTLSLKNKEITDISQIENPEQYYREQTVRQKAIQCIDYCNSKMKFNENPLLIKSKIFDFIKDIQDFLKIEKNEYIENILYDFSGQIKESLNMTNQGQREDWYSRWGCHYLTSLQDAYTNEICNNFKDKGVSNFTGKLFNELVDTISEIFDSLPPPKQTIYSVYSPGYSSTSSQSSSIDMRMYRNQGGGCCTGDCKIQLADNTYKPIYELTSNDILKTVSIKDSIVYEDSSEIECIVKTKVENQKIVLLPGCTDNSFLKITEFHPIIDRNQFQESWIFPKDAMEITEYTDITKYDYLYTFVMKNRKFVIIEDYIYATLGHNYKDKIISHNYFGSNQVISDLQKDRNYQNGKIYLTSDMFLRDSNTGNVNKIDINQQKINFITEMYHHL